MSMWVRGWHWLGVNGAEVCAFCHRAKQEHEVDPNDHTVDELHRVLPRDCPQAALWYLNWKYTALEHEYNTFKQQSADTIQQILSEQ